MIPLEKLTEMVMGRSYTTWLNAIKANAEALAGAPG